MRIDSNGTIWKMAYFKNAAIDSLFWCNGNKWRKVSTRTARPISKGIPERAFYFGQSELCEIPHDS
jgi:hypothetical protein